MIWLGTADCLVDTGLLTWEVEAQTAAAAEGLTYKLAEKSGVADLGSIEVVPYHEDKQLICDALRDLLGLTTGLCEIVSLEYHTNKEEGKTGYFYEEFVEILYKSGEMLIANVSMDSGAALIKDVLRTIYERGF